MTLPGPAGVAWVLGLLAWAATSAVVGECTRDLAGRWLASWRGLELVERLLLDFYLGGAVMYLVATVPVGAFTPTIVFGLPIAAAVVLVARRAWLRARGDDLGGERTASARWPVGALSALLVAFVLLVFELALALPIGTGNTYDSSLLTLYVSLLLQHHTIPLSFEPYASVGLLYPQGTTVWLGWAQLDFGLPAARTSLLVTPLFLALAPLGAYVFGRRSFGTDRAGLAAAVLVAAVGSWTRVLVGGSNDFVFAFPLVLLLAGQLVGGWRSRLPSWGDALAFGLLAGYSAAMNPVGAEWLLPSALVFVVVGPHRLGIAVRRLGRWAVAAGSALVPLIPTWIVLARGWGSPGLTPGAGAAPAGTPSGISPSQFVGSIDPYLFRPTDVWLSPVPFLRLELAILLTLGLAILVLARRDSALGRFVGPFREFVGIGAIVLVGLLGILLLASTGFGPAVRFADISSGAELSIWLFTLFTMIAALPFLLVVERAAVDARPAPPTLPATSPPRRRGRTGLPRGTVPVLLALLVVVPGVVLTPTELAPVLTHLYDDFGNVTTDDLALIEYAGSHLPAGSRVLVAPGSAAGFLPGYAPNLVLLYPMVPGWEWLNSSYRVLVQELTNGTLNESGESALSALAVEFVVVTGTNTVLYAAFSPAPFLADPGEFPVLFHAGDAYLFERVLPP